MSRERYNIELKCPECGQSGTFRVSENDYSFMRKLDRDVTCVEGEFEASMVSDSTARIKCKKCNNEFEQ